MLSFEVVSSTLMQKLSVRSLGHLRFTPASAALDRTAFIRSGSQRKLTVSKKRSWTSSKPRLLPPAASSCAIEWMLVAMQRSPSGPWCTAYMLATTAGST